MKIGHENHSLPLQLEWTDTLILGSRVRQDVSKEDVPRSRYLHACCLHGQNLYLHGGKDRYEPLKDFWKLEIGSWEWTTLETDETVLPHLQGHTMVPYKSQIFIFGGSFYETHEDTPLWIYSPDMNLMKKYACEEYLPRPVGRREHSAVTHKNIMYIFGGFLDSSGSSDEFWAFDMESEEWQAIPRNKPGPRHGHIAITHGNCMWIHGGMKKLTYLADLWKYNFALQTWNKVKGLGTCPALSGHTANVVCDNIVIIGGCRNGKPSADAWIFSLIHHTWRCIETAKEVPFSPVSLHASVLIDPVKLIQTDIETSAKSVPHLKTHTSLLPWHQNTCEPRPWTSPSPSSMKGSRSQAGLDSYSTVLDKNNNSEENLFNDSAGLGFTVPVKDMCDIERDETSEFRLDNSETNAVCRSKSDILKIRPASCEDCFEELPLLQRFHSSGSDVDYGQVNTILSLSDENILIQPSQENHQLLKSPINHAEPSECSISCNCHLRAGILETPPESVVPECPNHHSALGRPSPSTQNSNSSSLLHYTKMGMEDEKDCVNHHHEWSTEDKENFFTNPLYESVFGGNKACTHVYSNEKAFINVTSSLSKLKHIAQSSDLTIEDLEFFEEDSSLRNVSLAFPSNQSIRCSSLKDLTSLCHHVGNSGKSLSGMNEVEQNCFLLKSLSSSEINVTNKRPNSQKIDDLKMYHNGNEKKKHGHVHNLDKVKKQSRHNPRISRAYVKHPAMSVRTNSESHITRQNHDLSTIQDYHHFKSSGFLSSYLKESLPSIKSRQIYSQFTVHSKDESVVKCKPSRERSKTCKSPQASELIPGDQRSVLLILGGETESGGCEVKILKIWNCYVY